MCPPGVCAEADPGGALSGEDREDPAHAECQGVQLPGEQQVGTDTCTDTLACMHIHMHAHTQCK